MRNLTKLLGIIALVAVIGFSCAACDTDNGGGGGGGTPHTHTYATAWSFNATQHWHECTANDGAKSDEANHTSGDPCTVCGRLSYNLGDTGPGGGKIFYRIATGFTMTDDDTIAHYLEAAPNDMELAWASSAFIPSDKGGTGAWTDITGTATGIGTGRKNTALILATDANAPAAKACNDYSNNGKTDWFFPSKDELNQLWVNRASVGNLKITIDNVNWTHYYWSSSQIDSNRAWDQRFSDGGQFGDGDGKNDTFSVRAVRAF